MVVSGVVEAIWGNEAVGSVLWSLRVTTASAKLVKRTLVWV